MNSIIQKLGTLQDPMADEQANNIIRGHIPFLGFLDSAPDTTGWDTTKMTAWFEKSGAVYVLKFWDGAAVKTVTTS